jgi:hypothetical protein
VDRSLGRLKVLGSCSLVLYVLDMIDRIKVPSRCMMGMLMSSLMARRRRFRRERAVMLGVVLRKETRKEDGKLMKGLGVGDVDFHGEGMLRMGHKDS